MGLKRFSVMLGLLSALLLPVPAQAAPQGNARFLFNNVLLGGYINDNWVSAYDLQHSGYDDFKIWGGESWRVFNSEGLLGEGIVSAVQNEHPDSYAAALKNYDIRLPVLDVQTGPAPSDTLRLGSQLLTIDCPWDPMPRLPRSAMGKLEADPTVFIGELEKRGLKGIQPRLSQAFELDLNGDGRTETVMLSQNILPQGTRGVNWELNKPLLQGAALPEKLKAGQYSMILINWHGEEYPYRSEVMTFAAVGNAGKGNEIWEYPRVHKIEAFADLNGDGVLEIIISEQSSRAFAYTVVDVKQGIRRPLSDVTDHSLLGCATISGVLEQEVLFDGAYGYLIRDDQNLLKAIVMGNDTYAELAEARPGCRVRLDYATERYDNFEEPYFSYLEGTGRVLAPAPANWKDQSVRPEEGRMLELGKGHVRGHIIGQISWEDAYGYMIRRADGNIVVVSMGQNELEEFGTGQIGSEIELDYEMLQFYNEESGTYFDPLCFYLEKTGRLLHPSPVVLDPRAFVAEDGLFGVQLQ